MPSRFQIRRAKGWKKPENGIVVSRPSKWGNPFKVTYQNGIGLNKSNVFGETLGFGNETNVTYDDHGVSVREIHIASSLPSYNGTLVFYDVPCNILSSSPPLLTPKNAAAYSPNFTCTGTTLTLFVTGHFKTSQPGSNQNRPL